jgi:hypothetical protein
MNYVNAILSVAKNLLVLTWRDDVVPAKPSRQPMSLGEFSNALSVMQIDRAIASGLSESAEGHLKADSSLYSE